MLLQEELLTVTKSGAPIAPFVLPMPHKDLIFLATSNNLGFYAARVTPLYFTPNGDVPGDPLDISLGEYAYLEASEAPLKIRIEPANWLADLNLVIWRGLPDDPRPAPHNHVNKEILDRFTESESKLYYRGQSLPDHNHSNLAIVQKLSTSGGKLYYNDEPIAGQQPNNIALLNLLSEQNGKLYYNYSPVFPTLNLHDHDNFAVLSKFSQIEGKLLYNGLPIENDMSELETAINNQTTALAAKLESIKLAIEEIELGSGSTSELTLTLLTLNPTYTLNAPEGWTVTPSNLLAITDGDSNTSTNFFEVGGANGKYGELIIIPAVTISETTRINMRLGLQNSASSRSYFEVAVYNVSSSTWNTIWATIDPFNSSTETIISIDRMVPFSWNKIKLKIQDIGSFSPRAKIYELIVWSVP
jgi:hypothetical protein